MAIIVLCILFFLAAILFVQKFYIKPQKMIQSYKKKFEDMGYKVYLLPCNPFSFPHFDLFQRDEKKHNDALKTVKDLTNYDVIIGNLSTQPCISLLSTKLIKQMMIKEADWNYVKKKDLIDIMKILMAGGLVFVEGQTWKKKRKYLNQVFNFKLVSGFYKNIESICIETMKEQEQENNMEQFDVCMYKLAQKIFSTVTLEGFIGGNIRKQMLENQKPAEFLVKLVNQSFAQFLNPMNQICGRKLIESGIRKRDRDFLKDTKTFNTWALNFIQQRISIQNENIKVKGEDFEPKNIIEAVLFENYKYQKQGKSEQIYDLNEMLEEFKIFFFAGTDTTTNMFNMMIHYIFTHPEVQQKLREEIKQTSPDGQINFERTKNMKYLEAVQKQTLRMGGPFSKNLFREVVKDHYLDNVPIYKGTTIQFMAYTAHFNEEYYQKPYQFRPQRWINGECDNLNPFAFVPFSGGSRACIGKQLALLMSKIALIVFMNRYKSVNLPSDKIGIHAVSLFQGDKYIAELSKA